MPTYDYECEKCKRTFEREQRIVEPALTTCPLPTTEDRRRSFEASGGASTWEGRPFSVHPDRCVCQGDDATPHRHSPDGRCARCECEVYDPEDERLCGGTVRRLISGSTGFVLNGKGWFRDGY